MRAALPVITSAALLRGSDQLPRRTPLAKVGRSRPAPSPRRPRSHPAQRAKRPSLQLGICNRRSPHQLRRRAP
eukprot:7663897-Alexandrium_andersonii.AAC.1